MDDKAGNQGQEGAIQGYSMTLRQNWDKSSHLLFLEFSVLFKGQVISITAEEELFCVYAGRLPESGIRRWGGVCGVTVNNSDPC